LKERGDHFNKKSTLAKPSSSPLQQITPTSKRKVKFRMENEERRQINIFQGIIDRRFN
jgi:hypothetical protein